MCGAAILQRVFETELTSLSMGNQNWPDGTHIDLWLYCAISLFIFVINHQNVRTCSAWWI